MASGAAETGVKPRPKAPPFKAAEAAGEPREPPLSLVAPRIELAARLVEIAVQRAALVVAQALAALVALRAALGARIASALGPVVTLAPFGRLGIEVAAGVSPAGSRRRAREPEGEDEK